MTYENVAAFSINCTYWTDDISKAKKHAIIEGAIECPNCGAPLEEELGSWKIFEALVDPMMESIGTTFRQVHNWTKNRCFPDLAQAARAMQVYEIVERQIRQEMN